MEKQNDETRTNSLKLFIIWILFNICKKTNYQTELWMPQMTSENIKCIQFSLFLLWPAIKPWKLPYTRDYIWRELFFPINEFPTACTVRNSQLLNNCSFHFCHSEIINKKGIPWKRFFVFSKECFTGYHTLYFTRPLTLFLKWISERSDYLVVFCTIMSP